MDIALLNVKITVQKNETVVDAIGNHKNTWTDYHTCFATYYKKSSASSWTNANKTFSSGTAFT